MHSRYYHKRWGQKARPLLYIYIFLCIGIIRDQAQNETSKWYFGVNAGLDFMTSPPTILTNGQVAGMEGCSSISDSNGNLLFYSDGGTIWNKFHLPMANGTGLWGGPGATQSSVIVKQPGNSNVYFIFTLMYNCSSSLFYSTVDMSLASGMGSVTAKNDIAYSGYCVEKLTATKHCNKTDVWVVSHDLGSNNFRSFLVTSTGVSTVATVSSVGPIFSDCSGQMKLSPNGKKIGVPFTLFDFDNQTGVVSNSLALPFPQIPPGYFPGFYGCEFSPDGTKFYSSSACMGFFQWDLCAPTNSAIISSQYTTSACGLGLQLALDGKLYLADDQLPFVAFFANPNVYGAGINYNSTGQSVAPKLSRFVLPNFETSYFYKPKPFSFASDSTRCNKVFFSPPCSVSNSSITGMNWTFGDPNSGTANSSTLASPFHIFSSAGAFTVRLVQFTNCSSDTIESLITVGDTSSLNISGKVLLCSGETTTLIATGASSYTWNGSVNSASMVLTPTVTTSFTLLTHSSTNTCMLEAVVTVTVSECTKIETSNYRISDFNIYPNPTSGNFNIRTNIPVRISIKDALGRCLRFVSVEPGETLISLDNLTSGIYYITTDKTIQTFKIIVIKD